MRKKILLFILLISMFFMPNVYAEEDKFTIVSGDLDTINSEICFGNDCFYVIKNDGNILRLLAKYNITVEDNPVQSDDAEGISFSNSKYWGSPIRQDAKYVYDSNSNLYKYIEAYKNSIIEKGVVVEEARLINQEELYLCGVDVITYTWPGGVLKCDSFFWSGVAYDGSNIWTSELEQAYYDNSYFGIRPVLEIPTGWFSEENIVYMGSTNFVKASDGVTSNNTASVDLTFNDLGQSAKYESIIYNDTDEIMYVNDVNVEGLSESYVNVVLDDNSKNKQIEAGGASLVSFYVKTLSEEGAGRNLDDEVKINFLVSNSIVNPDTFSNNFEFLILIVILSVVVVCISNVFKNKKINLYIIIFSLFILGMSTVSADDYLKITVLGNIKYKSQNVIETTGTVLDGFSADYTNSKDVWAYYDKVKNIYVKSLVDKPKKYFKRFDLTLDDGNRVTAYLVENGDKTVPYDLYIMSNGVVIANEDSSFLFSFPNVEKIEGLANVDFSEAINMKGMFIGNTKLEKADVKSIDMSSVKDVSYMFYNNKKLNVTVKDFDVSNVENMEYMTQNYLYDVIKVNAGSDANLDYSASLDSGNFLYNKSKSEKNPIYYYRGNVDDNNVKFAGYCWQIVRTTDTGGIKLLYNGSPDENGYCIKYNSDAHIGVTKFNGSADSFGSTGYMYGTIVNYGKKSLTNDTNAYLYGNNVLYDEEKNSYTLVDTISIDNWNTNYKLSANKHNYTCFNDSGECESVYYIADHLTYYYTDYFVFYITLSNGQKIDDIKEIVVKNSNNSTVKGIVDAWYGANLVNYTNKLEDTIWCNDRTIRKGTFSSINYDASDLLDQQFSSDRVNAGTPNLKCSNTNDSFTVSESNGNGVLVYPIGLLTVDELLLMGAEVESTEKYFDNRKAWWLMTPRSINNTTSYVYRNVGWSSYNDNIFYGGLFHAQVGGTSGTYARPAISLKSGTQFVTGDGSYTKPYIIE